MSQGSSTLISGALYIGTFGTKIGLLDSGSLHQLGVQAIDAFGVAFYSFGMAYAIGWTIECTMGFRVTTKDELAGVDTVLHDERGYALVE
jgi:Amt family ammonium transporter